MTKVYLLEECHFNGKHDYVTVEITDEEAASWIEDDYQRRLAEASENEKAGISRRTCQQIVDEANNAYRASWTKFYRHNVIGLTYTNDDGDEVSIMDNIPDESIETPEEYAERCDKQDRVDAFLSTLTETQRRRTLMLMDGLTVAEIARQENASFNSIKECVEAIKKKYQKFFN